MAIVMYHGTAVDQVATVRPFCLAPPQRTTYTASQALGIFFARHRAEAEAYADAAMMEAIGAIPVVITAELNISRPYAIDVASFYAQTEYKSEAEILELRESLLRQGYDSIAIGHNGDIAVLHVESIAIVAQDPVLL